MSVSERIPVETEQAIVDLWKAGRHSTGDLTDQFGVSSTTVRRVLERNGVDLWKDDSRRHRRRTTPEQDEEIVARYLAGEPGQVLAAEFGFKTHVSVHQRVRAAGHSIRPPGNPASDPTPDQRAEIIRLRKSGWSQERIAEKVGVGQVRVSRYLISQGYRAWPLGRHPKYSGGPVKASSGYLYVKVDDKDPFWCMATQGSYISQHRYVVAQALGRPLLKGETVHHINGDKTDNRLENLQLRQGNHGTGVKFACLDCGSHRIGAVPLD